MPPYPVLSGLGTVVVVPFVVWLFVSLLLLYGHVALLSGGDVLAILLFSAIGRFSHGFSFFDAETLRTADPFIAGWFLSAYFLGAYGDDGRGVNGKTNAVTAAVKSWAVGVPVRSLHCV
ncbi:hypothetical protein Tco_1356204 [Tanacetum coccineum]